MFQTTTDDTYDATEQMSLIYWQTSFGRLKTADPDYAKTKRDRAIAVLLWLGASFIEGLFIVTRLFAEPNRD